MLNSSLCDYSNAYILVQENITIIGRGVVTAAISVIRSNKEGMLKNCAPFLNRINEINNIQVDNAKDLDIVMSIYNFIRLLLLFL